MALDLAQERTAAIELLATALDVSRPLSDLHEGALTFLVEELIAQRDRLLGAFVMEHGGSPAKGDGVGAWHLHRQFSSDVWNELAPDHKLYLQVGTANRDAVGQFVGELEQWIAFIERTVLELDGKSRWTYEDPSSRERFALQWDEQDDCEALLHAFEDHDLEQVGTVGDDGICIWGELANFSVPWPVIDQARRRQRARQ